MTEPAEPIIAHPVICICGCEMVLNGDVFICPDCRATKDADEI